jgi:tyrosine-protein kinase Etk/Wzc
MGRIQTLEDLIGLLIRRRLVIGAITVFGIVITVLYGVSKPDTFESTAVIQVQSATVARPDAGPARDSSAQRLQAIQQQLTTRDNMRAMIARHDLFAQTPLSDDEKVHLLRTALRFETVASAAATNYGQPAEVSALLISAQAETRAKAASLANDFAQGILNANATDQRQRAQEAMVFFQGEAQALQTQIDAQAAEIGRYQTQNASALPGQRDLLRLELTTLETELRALDQALVGARNARAMAEARQNLRATDRRQIDTLATAIATQTAQAAALESRRAEIVTVLTQAQNVDRALADYARNLAHLQSQYEVARQRSADAETAARLQDNRQGETFTLLERAAEPDYPISGGRRQLAVVGAVASLMLGVVAAFLLDQLRPVLRTRHQLKRELDLTPIVVIPEMRIKTSAVQGPRWRRNIAWPPMGRRQ